MKRAIFWILSLVLCVTLLAPVSASASGLEEADAIMQSAAQASFTVLHTGDINGKESGDESAIGFAKTAGYADALSEKELTILLDSGNALAGDGGKTISIMENAQYTAAAIGTKDAALGIERLQELSARANFPLLCANWLRADGDLLFDPYTILQVGGVKVGIIGLISPEIAQMYPEITEGCNVYEPGPIANIYYEEMLAQGCSYFIALTSLGYEGDYTPRNLGEKCPWINLILDSNTTEETALDLGELVRADLGVIVFNLLPDFRQLGEIKVSTGSADGMNTTLPAVYTAEDLKDVPESEVVSKVVEEEYVEPGTEITADGNGTIVVEKGEGGNTGMLLYLLSFAAIIGVTVAIIVYISKKPAKKTKK